MIIYINYFFDPCIIMDELINLDLINKVLRELMDAKLQGLRYMAPECLIHAVPI